MFGERGGGLGGLGSGRLGSVCRCLVLSQAGSCRPPPIFPADPAAEEGPRVPEMHIRGHQPLSVAALSRGGLCQVLVGLGQAELPQVGVAGGGGWGPPGTSALAARSQVGFAVLRDHPVTCAGTGWHPVH